MGLFNTENFIVRIYRHEGNIPQRIVGVVEQVGVEGKRAFHNFDELWAILASAKARLPGKEKDNDIKGAEKEGKGRKR